MARAMVDTNPPLLHDQEAGAAANYGALPKGGVDIAGAVKRDTQRARRNAACAAVAVVAAAITYMLPLNMELSQQQTLALLFLVCVLWATEAIPVWVTSLLIPFLIVICRILIIGQQYDPTTGQKVPDSTGRTDAHDSAHKELANLADPNVVLLMGGFTLALALNKYELDVRMANLVLSRAGTNPRVFLLVVMLVGYVMSMFVNNVAAPVMCFFIATPIMYKIPDRSYCQCMVMCIAFACNIGGMPTPIASPQNTAALTAIHQEGEDVEFLTWMAFSVPITLPALVFTWMWLLWFWKPELKRLPELELPEVAPLTRTHVYVGLVCLLTIGLWCAFEGLKEVFGSMGLIGLIPIFLLYGPGLLATSDFKKMDWNILMLLGGGASLGDAVKSSKLLDTLAQQIQDMFGQSQSESTHYAEFIFFSVVVMLVTNFISHTVGAITMMPVIARVGSSMTPTRTVPFVLGSVLMDSAACALPVSSFPNIMAFGLVDQHGERYLTSMDFIKASVGVELCMLALMSTVGWGLANSLL